MNCTTCYGRRQVVDPNGPTREEILRKLDKGERGAVAMVLCPDCGGSGKLHCCDGLQAQP